MVMLLVLVVGFVRPAGAQSELERAREDVREAQQDVDAALDTIAETQFRADQATAAFWEAQSALYALEEDIAGLDEEIAAATAHLDVLRDELRDTAVDAYIKTGQAPSIFETDDINQHAVTEALARFATDTRRDVVDEFRIVRDDLADAQERLAARTASQAAQIAAAEEARARIDEELASLDVELTALEEAMAVRESILADFEEEERLRIEEELRRQAEEAARRRAEEEAARAAAAAEEAARVAAQQAEEAARQARLGAESGDGQVVGVPGSGEVAAPPVTPVVTGATGWVCPLAGPFSHIDDFWAPRQYGGVHRANDLIADTGIPVVAVVSGEVEFRGGDISGLAVRVSADNGDWFFYGHLSAYENANATWVEAGTVIGYVGMTGNAPIPHLHFEWHQGGYGNYANPYPVVAASC
jgi:murein DD-endopeptidase MepM/ murein hydrolase activator NlpD